MLHINLQVLPYHQHKNAVLSISLLRKHHFSLTYSTTYKRSYSHLQKDNSYLIRIGLSHNPVCYYLMSLFLIAMHFSINLPLTA